MAKFDIPTEAARPLYAGVGATDLVVGYVRDAVADVQKRFAEVQKELQTRISDLDLEPKALREQALTVFNLQVDELSKETQARRDAIEARVAELQAFVAENAANLTAAYADLAKRGEVLVDRIRAQEATKATASSAKTTTAKAKTTKTQAKKSAKTTAKKATSTAKKSSATPKSSAKATATAAKSTASNAARAATDAAEKVGD